MKALFCPNCGNGKFVIAKENNEIYIICTECHYDELFYDLKPLEKVGE